MIGPDNKKTDKKTDRHFLQVGRIKTMSPEVPAKTRPAKQAARIVSPGGQPPTAKLGITSKPAPPKSTPISKVPKAKIGKASGTPPPLAPAIVDPTI